MLKSLLVALSVATCLFAALPAQAQPYPGGNPNPGPPSGVPAVRAPEFDSRSAGAGAVLVVGGALVLMSIRRRRSQPER